MNVFEFAMQMEQDGEAYYRELAQKAQNSGLKKIFTMLADEEGRHYATFKKIYEGMVVTPIESSVLDGVKNIFKEMKDSGKDDLSGELSQIDAYKKAISAEEKSYQLYEKKAAEVTNAGEKKILLAFAREERRHCRLLENVLKYVSSPDSWLEAAEFVHLDQE